MRTVIQRWLLCGAAVLLCVACGFKGPLYMPDVEPAGTPAKTMPVTAK